MHVGYTNEICGLGCGRIVESECQRLGACVGNHRVPISTSSEAQAAPDRRQKAKTAIIHLSSSPSISFPVRRCVYLVVTDQRLFRLDSNPAIPPRLGTAVGDNTAQHLLRELQAANIAGKAVPPPASLSWNFTVPYLRMNIQTDRALFADLTIFRPRWWIDSTHLRTNVTPTKLSTLQSLRLAAYHAAVLRSTVFVHAQT
ncbi:hypothetical protein K432DRAFT_403308 [Lepidopterella palustris CBS 459.81]|uniref:Uncharacterized protein n=1 Tax=Lepidopterella palustris CBS 459.81 TaxID=1314670 RepID=A0A8E2EDJ0_9PEZI|nr:hypothetical protein K432DRAFT_403308 [Lepidopterella palustris CBS 459.81]